MRDVHRGFQTGRMMVTSGYSNIPDYQTVFPSMLRPFQTDKKNVFSNEIPRPMTNACHRQFC